MDQEGLSATLQLLENFYYSTNSCGLPLWWSDVRLGRYKEVAKYLPRSVESEFRILHAIAVAMATGNPGDDYATAFDKDGGLTLVLTKSGPVTKKDEEALRQLLCLSSIVDSPPGLFPFLFKRGCLYINRRIQRVKDTINKFCEFFDEELPRYDCLSFPKFRHIEIPKLHDDLQHFLYKEGPLPETKEIISDVFRAVQVLSNEISIVVGSEDERSRGKFLVLVLAATVLWRSKFLNTLCEPSISSGKDEQRFIAQKLKRRLARLAEYHDNMNLLILGAHDLRGSPLTIRWAKPVTNIGAFVSLPSLPDAIRSFHPSNKLKTDVEIQSAVAQQFPTLERKWVTNQEPVHTCVHAEIYIILYFLQNAVIEDENDRFWGSWYSKGELELIGCSKRSCFACTLWIEAYNNVFGTRWMTSGKDGRPCAAWTFPVLELDVCDQKSDKMVEVKRIFYEKISRRVNDFMNHCSI